MKHDRFPPERLADWIRCGDTQGNQDLRDCYFSFGAEFALSFALFKWGQHTSCQVMPAMFNTS